MEKRGQWMKIPVGTAITLMILFSFARAGSGADITTLRSSYGGTAGYQLPIWVVKEAGLYKKYGVPDMEVIMIEGGAVNIQALLGGSLDMTQTSASSPIQAALKGAPVVIVATTDNKIPVQMISRSDIKTPQQLKGKTIGIVRFGGSNETAVKMALKEWNIELREVKILPAGGAAARMAAMASGRIDATVQSYPEIYQAKKLGMNILADIGDFGSYTNTSLIVTRSFLQQNRALTKNMIKAVIEAIHYIKTNKPETLRVLKKYMQMNDMEAIGVTYDFFSKRMPRVPRTDPEGVKNILDEIKSPLKDYSGFLDMSLVDEIEREGFIQKVYGPEKR